METRAPYRLPGAEEFADLASRDCCRLFSDPLYRAPTPEEVTGLIKLAGWSQTDTAKLVGVTFDPKKGSQTIRRWRSPVHSGEHRAIPYSAWRLLLLHAGLVSVSGDISHGHR